MDNEGSGNNISGGMGENLIKKVVESGRSGKEIYNSRRKRANHCRDKVVRVQFVVSVESARW